jgi:hypothetical protein
MPETQPRYGALDSFSNWSAIPATALLLLHLGLPVLSAQHSATAADNQIPRTNLVTLPEGWTMSAPLVSPERRTTDVAHAVKDPSVVYDQGRWHVFMTIKCKGRTIMETCSFADWEMANQAPRTVLNLFEGDYYGAPQVFFFRPHSKWYLIYQVGVPGRKFMHVAYSTTTTLEDPGSWSKPEWVFPDEASDGRTVGGLDYWMICDEERAYFFWTSLDGRMWRMWTTLAEFPRGFRDCQLALQGDIFEASHTYRLKGMDQYLTIIEANPGGKRYFKAYVADRLDGEWLPLADTEEKPFAGAMNVRAEKGVTLWADNISHGELLRDGADETLTVDSANLRMLFQGAWEKDKRSGYGAIPWRLGLLIPSH